MRRAARRILMTTDAVGGVFVYATNLARALCRSGNEVTLVVMGPAPAPEQIGVLQDIGGLQFKVTDLALEWMDPQGSDTARARKVLPRIAERVRPDIVHLNSYREAQFAWPAPSLVVAHSCVMSWWQACRGDNPNEERWQTYADAVAAGLQAADVWVAPSAAMRGAIDAIYHPSKPGRVIWNGVDLPSPGARNKEPFILAAGRLWDEAKNLRTLTTIAPALDWPVRVAGPLDPPEAITNKATVAGVECLGAVPQAVLMETIRQAGIFVAPAFYEPFGLTVLEAAASGCALVLSDIPSFRELWDGAALFANPRDREALLAAVQQLCRDTDLRSRMQHAAAARARRYSQAATVSAYVDLYERMRSTMPASSTRGSAKRLELRA